MEEQLVAARAHLRHLLHDHPDWPYQEYADQIGRPRDWVKRWVKRLREAPATHETVLWNRSSARPQRSSPLLWSVDSMNRTRYSLALLPLPSCPVAVIGG